MDGHLDIAHVLDILRKKYKVKRLLVEGGSTVLKSFLLSGHFDEFTLYIGPMMVGQAPSLICNWETFGADDAPNFKIKSATMMGEGLMLVLDKGSFYKS